MRKEVIWGVALAIGVGAIVTGVFLLPDGDDVVEVSEESVIERMELFSESVGREPEYPEDYDFDKDEDLEQVTRIVVDGKDKESDEISDILSEKVIVNDKVVDKNKAQ